LENANLYFIEDRLHELLEVTGLLLFKVDVWNLDPVIYSPKGEYVSAMPGQGFFLCARSQYFTVLVATFPTESAATVSEVYPNESVVVTRASVNITSEAVLYKISYM
jgi:hypothetical protein